MHTAKHISNVALGFFTTALQQAGHADVNIPNPAPMVPKGTKVNPRDIMAYGGGSFTQFQALESQLGQWFGPPAIRENHAGDYLIGRGADYKNGIVLNYLADRDGGITMTVPKTVLPALKQQVQAALLTQSMRDGPGR